MLISPPTISDPFYDRPLSYGAEFSFRSRSPWRSPANMIEENLACQSPGALAKLAKAPVSKTGDSRFES